MKNYNTLSNLEKNVIDLFLEGNLSSKEISVRLSTTENAVNKAFQRIKDKYDLITKSDIFIFFNNERKAYIKHQLTTLLSI